MADIYNRIERNRGYLLASLAMGGTRRLWDIFGPDAIGQYWACGPDSLNGVFYILSARGDVLYTGSFGGSLTCGAIDKYGFAWMGAADIVGSTHRVLKVGQDGSTLAFFDLTDGADTYKPFGMMRHGDYLYVVGINDSSAVVRLFEIDVTPGSEAISGIGELLASAGAVEESMRLVDTGLGGFWCADSNRTGDLIRFSLTDLGPSAKTLTWGVGAATAGLMGLHAGLGYIWLGGDTTNSVGSSPPQIAKVDPTDGNVVAVLQFSDALRISDFDDDGTFLYAAVSGKVGASDIGDNRIVKLLPDNENRFNYSEEFDNVYWSPGGCTITPDAAPAPPGFSGTISDDLVEDTGTTRHEVVLTGLTGSQRITQSVYVKANGRTLLTMRGSAPWGTAYFDLSTGTLAQLSTNWALDKSNTKATITDLGSGWFRCSVSRNLTGTPFVATFGAAEDTTTTSYTGSGTSALLLFGAQLTYHAELSSYVKTTAAPVTGQLTVEDSFNFDGGSGEELRTVAVVSDEHPTAAYPDQALIDASLWFRGDDPERARMIGALRHLPNRGPQKAAALVPEADYPSEGAINSIQALSFDGSNDDLRAAGVARFSRFSTVFDGVDEHVTFGGILSLDRTDSFSFSGWFRTSYTGGTQMLFGKHVAASPTGYWMEMWATGQIGFAMTYTWVSNSMFVYTTATGFNDGRWHHVVVTHDSTVGGGGKAAGIKIYVDGVDQALTVQDDTLASSIITVANFWIGDREGDSPTYVYDGRADEFSAYSKVLSQPEVTAIFNDGSPPDLATLSTVGDLSVWWRMGDGDSYPTIYGQVDGTAAFPIIPDESVSGNDGTMTNMLASNIQVPVPWSKFSQYSYNFDGTADYVTMGNLVHLEYDIDWSISFWFWTTTTGGYFVCKQDVSTQYRGYGVAITGTGAIDFWIRNNQGTGDAIHVETTATGLNDGQWHHVVATWKGNATPVASDAHIYIDGVEDTSILLDNLTATILNTASFNLMARDDGTDAFRGHFITDVAIYDKELDAAEVTWMYNSGEPRDLRLPAAPSDLAAWWRIGEAGEVPQSSWVHKVQQWVRGFGTKESATITDASHLDSDGTLRNMVAGDVTTDTSGGISDYSCTFDGLTKCMTGNVGSSGYGSYLFENGEIYSLAGWVKTTATSGWLFGNGRVYAAGLPNFTGYGVYLDAGRPAFILTPNSGSTSKLVRRCDSTINDGSWHFVVVTQRKIAVSNHVVRFYVDSVLQTSTLVSNTVGNSSVNGGDWSVGGQRNTADGLTYQPCAAQIDETSVWTKELTQADVTALWNGGAPIDLRDHKPTIPWLRGWWRMGDPYYAPGTVVGGMEYYRKSGWAPGAPVYTSRSCYFDSSNDHVVIGDVPEIDFEYDEPFSVSAWVIPWGASAFRAIASKGTGYANPGWYFEYYGNHLRPQGMIRVIFIAAGGTGSGFFEVYAGSSQRPLPYAQWLHIVMTYDGSNDGAGIKFWINGDLIPTQVRYNTAFSGTFKNSNPVEIGSGSGYWSGFEDEISIWDKELSAAEVTEIWNSGDPADLSAHSATANLVGWWRMGEGSFNGTMVNMEPEDFLPDVPLPPERLALLHDGSAFTLLVAFQPVGSGTQTILTTIEGAIANTETGMALVYDGTAETLRLVIANGSGVDYVLDKTTAAATVPLDGIAVVSVRVDFSDTPEAEIKMWTTSDFAEVVVESGTATAQTPSSSAADVLCVGSRGAGNLDGAIGEGVVIERRVTDFELFDLARYFMRWMP